MLNRVLLSARTLGRLNGRITNVRFNSYGHEAYPPLQNKFSSPLATSAIFVFMTSAIMAYPTYFYWNLCREKETYELSERTQAELDARRKARQARIDAATKK